MVLPQIAADAIIELHGRFPNLARGSDDERRLLTYKMAEQLSFLLGSSWGTKSTSKGSPQSKDALAYLRSDGTMDIWDWQNGETREPHVFGGMEPQHPRTAGQYFIEVAPVNHIGLTGPLVPPTPVPTPVPPPPVVLPPAPVYDFAQIEKRLEEIAAQLDGVLLGCDQLEIKLNELSRPRVYIGNNVPFRTLTLTEKQ